jgi:putative ABC transport system permease protein
MRAVRLLSLRRLRAQPLRAALAVLAVGAGVSLATTIVVVATSVSASFREFGQALGGPAELRVIGATARGGLDESVLGRVEGTRGVAAAVPIVQAVTVAVGGGERVTVVALGVDCRIEQLVGPIGCASGRVDPDPTTSGVVMAPTLVQQLGTAARLRTDAGDVDLTDAPTVGALARVNGGRVVALPLPDAQRLFARPSALDAIYVEPGPGADVGALRQRLERVVGSHNAVLAATDPPPQAELGLGAILPLFTLLSVFALVLGTLLVYNVVTLSLQERRRQLAIVAALGARSRTVIGGTLAEAAAIGAAGGLLGAVGGFLLADPITATLGDFTRRFVGIPVTVHTTATPWILGLALGIGVAVAASVMPVRRALRLDVAAELSNRELRAEAAPALRLRRGLYALAVSVGGIAACYLSQLGGGLEPWQATVGPFAFLVAVAGMGLAIASFAPGVALAVSRLFGTARRCDAPTRLALANLVREPGRTGVVCLAVGSAVAVAFVTASYTRAVHDGITDNVARGTAGRVRVSTLGAANTINIDARMAPDVIDALNRFPGVARVDRSAAVLTGHDADDLIGVVAFDHNSLPYEVLNGTKNRRAFRQGEVFIGPGLARRRDLRAGDELRLSTPTGNASVPVLGVWQDGDFNGNGVTMSMELLTALYGPQPPTDVYLTPTDGLSDTQLAARVNAADLAPDLEAQTSDAMAREISADVTDQIAPFWVLQRGMLAVAFVAVVSTLLLIGSQRRRELGLLAAVGMKPGELARMTLTEAGLVGAIGALLGAIGSLGMLEALRQVLPILVGFRHSFRLDLAALGVYIPLTLLVVLIAAALPAWRTSRLEVLEALQYE